MSAPVAQSAPGGSSEPLIDLALSLMLPSASWDETGDRVYFLDCNSQYVKIGVTTDVCARVRSLRYMNPYPLELVALLDGDRALEQQLHAEFADLRIDGEWFRYSGALARLLSTRTAIECRSRRLSRPSRHVAVGSPAEPEFSIEAMSLPFAATTSSGVSLEIKSKPDQICLTLLADGEAIEAFLTPAAADQVAARLERHARLARGAQVVRTFLADFSTSQSGHLTTMEPR